MLQLENFYQQCYLDFCQNIYQDTNEECKQDQVKKLSQLLFKQIEKRRSSLAEGNLLYAIDKTIWTDTIEHIDEPHFCINSKKEIIKGLHLKNSVFGTYNIAINLLKPFVEDINNREHRPARILEIGSGLGKLTFALYEKACETSMDINLTGSDIVPEYVKSAIKEAHEKKLNIDFKVIDAFNLDQLEPNSFDIIFNLHGMHHFSPEHLSMIMSGSQRVATKAFIGLDAYRGFGNLFFMITTGALASLWNWDFSLFHDSAISGRKMYSAKQLEIMAKIGCRNSTIITERLWPGLTAIKILTNK